MGKMYSIREAAKLLGVTTYTIRNWCQQKKIKAVKIPDNSLQAMWRISEEEINKLTNGEPKQ